MTARPFSYALPALLLTVLFCGCATTQKPATQSLLPANKNLNPCFARARQTITDLFPARYQSTQRVIITRDGKQFTCDGLLKVSPREGHHLALVSNFGVVTDLRVANDGACKLLKVTPLFRADWSRRFVARDLRRLFMPPKRLKAAGQTTNGSLVLQTEPDANGVVARYFFSPDGASWRELDLMRNAKTFYRAWPGDFGKFSGSDKKIPKEFEVTAEDYQLELRITTLKPEVSS